MSFPAYLKERARRIDKALDRCLPPVHCRPALIHRAMRYSIFSGGKRIRPILCLAACEAANGSINDAMDTACALELIHTYSLIHDDLPCMDDDDLRRGKPTCHKVFGEGIAVLTGDALLTLAFELLAKNSARLSAGTGLRILRVIADAAGSRHLIGGQTKDLCGEGKKVTISALHYIHLHKTAALIEACVEAGALIAEAPAAMRGPLKKYGRNIGLAFQIADDILDVTGEEQKLGKRVRKDAKKQKATYPGIVGLEKSRVYLRRLTQSASASLHAFGPPAEPLRQIAKFIASRER